MRMNKKISLFFFLSCLLGLWLSCASSDVDKADASYDGHNVTNSGCLRTRSGSYGFEEPEPFIVLTKEGSIVSCELHNYDYNCFSSIFKVDSEIRESSDGPDTLAVNCWAVKGELQAHCTCQFNIYFVVRDVKADELYLKCVVSSFGYVPFEGMVSFKDSSTVTLHPVLSEWGYYLKTQIVYRKWVLEGYGSEEAFRQVASDGTQDEYYIKLYPDSTMEGRSLCNEIHGTYECHGPTFTFNSFGSTKAYCADETAQAFEANLPKVRLYNLDDDCRMLLYYSDKEFFRFHGAESTDTTEDGTARSFVPEFEP